MPGRFEDRTVLRWAADGRGVLVRDQSMPVQISHVALDSGRMRPELTVPSRLYLVEGLASARR